MLLKESMMNNKINNVNDALNVRRNEAKENDNLKGTRFIRLKNTENLTIKQLEEIESLAKLV